MIFNPYVIFLDNHYVKSVRIQSYSGPHFLRIQCESEKMWTRITLNTDAF